MAEPDYIYYCVICNEWISGGNLFINDDDKELYCGVCETDEEYNTVWNTEKEEGFERKERGNIGKGENELSYEATKEHFKQSLIECKGDWIQVCSCYSFHQACSCTHFYIYASDPYFGSYATDFRN